MFNTSSTELLLVCIIALIVIGPERLPRAIKTASLWIGRFRRSFYKVKAEIERELNTDEIRRQLHNESVLAEIELAKSAVTGIAKDTEKSMSNIVSSDTFDPGASKYTKKVESEGKEKTIKQNLDESDEVAKDIANGLYGSGTNPKLAIDSTSEDSKLKNDIG